MYHNVDRLIMQISLVINKHCLPCAQRVVWRSPRSPQRVLRRGPASLNVGIIQTHWIVPWIGDNRNMGHCKGVTSCPNTVGAGKTVDRTRIGQAVNSGCLMFVVAGTG